MSITQHGPSLVRISLYELLRHVLTADAHYTTCDNGIRYRVCVAYMQPLAYMALCAQCVTTATVGSNVYR